MSFIACNVSGSLLVLSSLAQCLFCSFTQSSFLTTCTCIFPLTIHIHTCAHTCTHVHTHAHMRTHMHMCTHAHNVQIHVHMHSHYTHTCTHTCTYMHTYMYICTHTSTYFHTYALLTHSSPQLLHNYLFFAFDGGLKLYCRIHLTVTSDVVESLVPDGVYEPRRRPPGDYIDRLSNAVEGVKPPW